MTLPPQQPPPPPQYPPEYPQQQYPPQSYPPGSYPPQPPARRRLSPGVLVLLFVGIPLLLLALLVAGIVGAANAFRGEPVNESVDADAGSSLFVDAPNAAIHLRASDDGQIHATMRGSSAGADPTLEVTEANGTTEIRGGCPTGWFLFNRCRVQIQVAVPADLDVTVGGQNGPISAEGIDGDLDLSTTNGSIEVENSGGTLMLHSTNGRIELDDSASTEVEAETTNGEVHLSFSEAPDEVSANSTNGEIEIEVPDDGTEYFVDADTTNGRVDTEEVPGDRRADRTISAETTNGDVTIETSGR